MTWCLTWVLQSKFTILESVVSAPSSTHSKLVVWLRTLNAAFIFKSFWSLKPGIHCRICAPIFESHEFHLRRASFAVQCTGGSDRRAFLYIFFCIVVVMELFQKRTRLFRLGRIYYDLNWSSLFACLRGCNLLYLCANLSGNSGCPNRQWAESTQNSESHGPKQKPTFRPRMDISKENILARVVGIVVDLACFLNLLMTHCGHFII